MPHDNLNAHSLIFSITKNSSNGHDKQKEHFTQILICFISNTGEEWIFQLKMTTVPFSFFDQSEVEKIPKKTKVKYWTICAMETTDEWTLMLRILFPHWPDARFDPDTVDDITLFIPVHYAAVSISFHFNWFVLNMEGHWFARFTSNKIGFEDDLICQRKFTVWAKWCSSVIERKKGLTTTTFRLVLSPPDWVLFDLRNKWEVDFFNQNNFSKTLIFQPIRVRESTKKNKS